MLILNSKVVKAGQLDITAGLLEIRILLILVLISLRFGLSCIFYGQVCVVDCLFMPKLNSSLLAHIRVDGTDVEMGCSRGKPVLKGKCLNFQCILEVSQGRFRLVRPFVVDCQIVISDSQEPLDVFLCRVHLHLGIEQLLSFLEVIESTGRRLFSK